MAALLTFLSTFKLFKSSSVSLELEPLHQHFSQQIVADQHFSQLLFNKSKFNLYEA